MPESTVTLAACGADHCERPRVPSIGFEAIHLGCFFIETGYCTHVGGRKAANEDSLFLAQQEIPTDRLNNRGRLWAVADGMGGHNGGKFASALACRALQDYFNRPLTKKGFPSPNLQREPRYY